MNQVEIELTPELRARLALKGRILYGKFCGTGGRGICAESFALYHLWRGEAVVARDLLAFLDDQILALRERDPHGRLALTEELAGRILKHLEVDADDPPDPSLWCSILKARKVRPAASPADAEGAARGPAT